MQVIPLRVKYFQTSKNQWGPGAKEAFCVVPAYPVTLQNKSYKGTDANDRPSIPKAKRKM